MARRPARWQGLFATVQARRRLRAAALVGAAALAGYVVAFVAWPAPIVAENHAVALVFGLPEAEATAALTRLGFKVKVAGSQADAIQPAGHVLWQEPAAYTVLEEGATVRLTLSTGPEPAPVPDLVGFEAAPAARTLATAGFRVGATDTIAAGAEPGVVVATRPSAGAGRLPGSAVDLVVSRGPANIRIPDLVGLTEDEARFRLEAAGLRVGRVRTRTGVRGSSVSVMEQRPAAGTLSPREGRVDLVVSRAGSGA